MSSAFAPASSPIIVRPVEDAEDRKEFVDLAWTLNKDDPNWVPPLKTEVHGLIDPRTNPWFEHAEARLFIVGVQRSHEVLLDQSAQPVQNPDSQIARLTHRVGSLQRTTAGEYR